MDLSSQLLPSTLEHARTEFIALANKLARICYAVLRDHEPYGAAKLNHKRNRVAFAMPM